MGQHKESSLPTLDKAGLLAFQLLQPDAVSAVTERFYATHGSAYERFGERGRQACREDLAFHLEFLRPVVEFGVLQPMVDYLLWLESVLQARAVPAEHLGQSLEWLGDFFGEHMEGTQGEIVRGALITARERFVEALATPVAPEAPPEAWAEVEAFEAALLAGNQREAMAIVNRALDAGHSLIDIELHVMRAALYDIGGQWQANKVSVAQEHMASAIVQSVMTQALLRSTPPRATGQRVLVACVEGNNHAIGVRMVADAFQLAGWDVQFLGANVPTTALIEQVNAWRPHLVCLSVSFAQHLTVARSAIAQLEATMGTERPAVIMGGLAFNRFAQLADFAGADSCGSDPAAAVKYGSQLVGITSQDDAATWWAPDLEPLLAVVTATLDEAATLIAANAGFLRLVRSENPAQIGDNVSRFFSQPTFDALVAAPVDEHGDIHKGLLTIGDPLGAPQSLRARVSRAGEHLRVLAEYDIEDLERLNTVVLELNREYANAQVELAQTNLKLQQREAEIREASLTDQLTGVGNRRRLEEALALEVQRAKRTGEPLAAFMADLDHFKRVNDRYGHQAGDDVLAAFGQLLLAQTRATDIVARFGGEEFVVLLPHTGLAEAVATAERTREALALLDIEAVPYPVTGSFGIAVLAPGEGAEGLMRRLDTSLYAAKDAGRNRVVAA